MERLLIDLGEDSYYIDIDEDLLEIMDKAIDSGDKIVLITDKNVDNLYGKAIEKFLKDKKPYKITIPPGEKSKTMATVEYILSQMLDCGLTRNSKVIALGGGVVGDIAGFSASIYMRGIDFVQVPTTLLAQVDSSVGGKTGINMPAGKNTVGSFYQPKAVLIDTKVLKTLPKRELISGIGEVIKYGIIYDDMFLNDIKNEFEAILKLDYKVMKKVIRRCCEIKAAIVSQDEKEKGIRKILNFGHTIGHGLEAITNYKKYTHGEAVIIGMYYEAKLAKSLGYIKETYFKEITDIIHKTEVSLDITMLSLEDLTHAMIKDKKNRGEKISFILPIDKGKVKEVLLFPNEVMW
ncbi:MAG: 3-dehydroquinate synthase [Clostridiaceae bacterium]|nr:3-dehydroquinate synthase [Clostridiaceae bacterium]